jgi:hypothetical protein
MRVGRTDRNKQILRVFNTIAVYRYNPFDERETLRKRRKYIGARFGVEYNAAGVNRKFPRGSLSARQRPYELDFVTLRIFSF